MGKRGRKPNVERNAEIQRLYNVERRTITELAETYAISRQRINQIVHPDRSVARRAVTIEVRKGRMSRPEACAQCGLETSDIEAHHGDYSRPLDVAWLCLKCHSKHKRGERRPKSLESVLEAVLLEAMSLRPCVICREPTNRKGRRRGEFSKTCSKVCAGKYGVLREALSEKARDRRRRKQAIYILKNEHRHDATRVRWAKRCLAGQAKTYRPYLRPNSLPAKLLGECNFSFD